MTTITIQINDSKAAMLKDKAEKHGLSVNQFLLASIEDLLSLPDSDFEAAMKKVLAKNADLYKRLA